MSDSTSALALTLILNSLKSSKYAEKDSRLVSDLGTSKFWPGFQLVPGHPLLQWPKDSATCLRVLATGPQERTPLLQSTAAKHTVSFSSEMSLFFLSLFFCLTFIVNDLFWAVLGLHCCMWAFSSCSK